MRTAVSVLKLTWTSTPRRHRYDGYEEEYETDSDYEESFHHSSAQQRAAHEAQRARWCASPRSPHLTCHLDSLPQEHARCAVGLTCAAFPCSIRACLPLSCTAG